MHGIRSKYLNVWCGSFTGSEAGLLGFSTFPFTSDEGPQGCVINIKTLPVAGNVARSYYPTYSEGSTLSSRDRTLFLSLAYFR